MNTVKAQAVNPHLELEPHTTDITSSGKDINVIVDTGDQEIKSAKTVMNYDPDMIEITNITPGSFFDEVSYNIYSDNGEIVINANLSLGSSLDVKNGRGVIATLSTKAKTNSGSTAITFSCLSGSSTDSGLNSPEHMDIISCIDNVNGMYELSDGGSNDNNDDGDDQNNYVDNDDKGDQNYDDNNTYNNQLPKAGSSDLLLFTLIGFISIIISFLSFKVIRKSD